MNPQDQFCPNLVCPARGQIGKGNIGVQSQVEQRYICRVCSHTFRPTVGTVFYRLRTDPKIVLLVLALLVYGCPLPAIVHAFHLDERTVRKWWQRAGKHCQEFHQHQVGHAQLDLGQVQTDEIKVKAQRRHWWMALAMMVPTRLWLGGAVSAHRDEALIEQVAAQVRAVALCRPLLIAVDGWWAYLGAFRKAFRTKLERRPGESGRPRWIAWAEVAIVQVIKPRNPEQWEIKRQIVQGSQTLIQQLLQQTQAGGVINTAFVERLNATFRQRLDPLTRRTRTLARRPETLSCGMWILGCVYNFCDFHHSLRIRLWVGERGYRWVQRTPALAAGLTDHPWSFEELFACPVPPPRWTLPKRKGAYSNKILALAKQWSQ